MSIDVDPGLASSLDRGYTLPASWYTDPVRHTHELDRIFHRCWQYVGMAGDMASHGDFLTGRLGEVPIVVVRDEEGRLRGFVNVCRHRGSTLVLEEYGCKKSIQCHYHAWTYGLDGRLRAAPGAKAEANFDPSEFSLVPIRVETWGPFVFVNLDPAARPLMETLGELPRLVEETGVPLNRIRRRRRDTYDIAANWKVVIDNYLECYHCPTAHPGFSDLIDLDRYTIHLFDLFSAQAGPVSEKARRRSDNLYVVEEGVEAGLYVFLWPNFALNIYPGPGHVSLNLFLPTSNGETRAIYEYCLVDEVEEQEGTDFITFLDQIQREDIVLCESVQQGLRSGYFDQGRLMLSRERALQHFQKLVYRFTAGTSA